MKDTDRAINLTNIIIDVVIVTIETDLTEIASTVGKTTDGQDTMKIVEEIIVTVVEIPGERSIVIEVGEADLMSRAAARVIGSKLRGNEMTIQYLTFQKTNSLTNKESLSTRI